MWWLVAVCYRYLGPGQEGVAASTLVRYVQALDDVAAVKVVTDELERRCSLSTSLHVVSLVVVYSAQVREGLRELVDGWPV